MSNKLTLTKNDYNFLNKKVEDDIYQQADNRTWKSYIFDVYEGDNFAEFCEDYFELLDELDYWD